MSLRNRTAGRTDHGKTLVRDCREFAITCESCRNLHLTRMFFGLYGKTRLKATFTPFIN